MTSHRFLYSTQEGEEADAVVSRHLRASLDPLLTKHRVSLFIAGHQHSYERTAPLVSGRDAERGTVHVIVGTGGASLEKDGFAEGSGWTVAARSHTLYGYARLLVTPLSLTLSFINDADGSVADAVQIYPWT